MFIFTNLFHITFLPYFHPQDMFTTLCRELGSYVLYILYTLAYSMYYVRETF